MLNMKKFYIVHLINHIKRNGEIETYHRPGTEFDTFKAAVNAYYQAHENHANGKGDPDWCGAYIKERNYGGSGITVSWGMKNGEWRNGSKVKKVY